MDPLTFTDGIVSVELLLLPFERNKVHTPPATAPPPKVSYMDKNIFLLTLSFPLMLSLARVSSLISG